MNKFEFYLCEGPSLGVLEQEVEEVGAVEVRPLVHRLRDHVDLGVGLKIGAMSESVEQLSFQWFR